jgi:hypothetical protein
MILDRAEDVPYNVQALASTAWELLSDEGGTTLTPGLVERALQLLVRRDGTFYSTLWNGLTRVQQQTLMAAVKERGMALTSAAVTQKYRVSASTMSKTLRFLEQRELLRREARDDCSRWRLEDPFFAAWLGD